MPPEAPVLTVVVIVSVAVATSVTSWASVSVAEFSIAAVVCVVDDVKGDGRADTGRVAGRRVGVGLGVARRRRRGGEREVGAVGVGASATSGRAVVGVKTRLTASEPATPRSLLLLSPTPEVDSALNSSPVGVIASTIVFAPEQRDVPAEIGEVVDVREVDGHGDRDAAGAACCVADRAGVGLRGRAVAATDVDLLRVQRGRRSA